MSGSIADTAALMKGHADSVAELVSAVEEAAPLLYTAPDSNREFWCREMEGYRKLSEELRRFARISDRAERALARGLKRKRWEKRV
ncbi:MAG: hypothetical protein NVV60_02065 [Luteimonas sp.]|nr:hypothetical protein [Luteimonas sp.]